MFRCDKFNDDGKPCAYWDTRRWNLERHIAAVHKPVDEWEDLKTTLSYLELPKGHDLRDTIAYEAAQKQLIWSNTDAIAVLHPFPASSVHFLLFPTTRTNLSPAKAFADVEFRTCIQEEAAKLKTVVGMELQRLYGRYSKQDVPREAMLNGDIALPASGELPNGRDWAQESKIGILQTTTLSRLHIHVLSVDISAEHLETYNSFTTQFFIKIDNFPIAPGAQKLIQNLKQDAKCWRCGLQFADVSELQEHLASEVKNWRAD